MGVVLDLGEWALRDARDCLHPLSPPHVTLLCWFSLSVSSLGINYPFAPIDSLLSVLPVCVCLWMHVPSMSVSLSFFLCSFPRVQWEQRVEWNVLDHFPPPRREEQGHLLPPLSSPLPILTSAADEMKAVEEWFDYLPDLCQCRNVGRSTCFPPMPLCGLSELVPKEALLFESASEDWMLFKAERNRLPALLSTIPPLSRIVFTTDNNYWQ